MRAPFVLSPLLLVVLSALAQAEDDIRWPDPLPVEAGGTVVEADAVSGESNTHLQASGDVRVQQTEREVQADEVNYFAAPERVIARGRVRYRQAGLVLQADTLDYLTGSQTGTAEGVVYQVQRQGRSGHGDAARVSFVGPQHYQLEQARFSTCDPSATDWYIGAGHLDLDYGRNLGVVRNATLHFFDVPIGWFPWLDFPLNGQRKSGILPPRIGTISSSGLDISVPYYWNIAPNLDMTFTPRFMAQRGTQLSTENRYLQRNSSGSLTLEWLGNDAKAGRDRYGINFSHQQRFFPRVTAGINYQRVSDYAYFADFGDRLSAATQVTLPQEAWVDFTSTHWQALGRIQRYQTLQDPSLPIAPPYWREPQLLVEGAQPIGGKADLHLAAEWVQFRRDPDAQNALAQLGRPAQVEGQRLHLYPAVAWNLNTPYAFITPRAGLMLTDYELDRTDNSHISRAVPVVSLDSAVTFEREFDLGGGQVTQTLEPRLYYVYIPYRDQSNIPNFDTNELTFNFAQMFSENRFSGVDKINDANQLTMALTSRFLDTATGRERLRLAVGQRLYFDEQRVRLDETDEGAAAARSDILFSASGSINDKLRFDSALQYDQSSGHVQRSAVSMNYQPQAGRSINLGYHYTRDDLRQIDVSAQWPLAQRWYGLGRALYSLSDNDLLESIAGVEYNAGCWSLRVVRQRYVVAADRRTSAMFVMLELNGLTGIGTNPLSVLRDGIFGYRKSNELSGGNTATP